MHILHCITCLSGDGAQRLLLRLAAGLKEQGYRSTVVTLDAPGGIASAFNEFGVPVFSLGMRSVSGALAGTSRLCRVLQQQQPDVAQGWMYHANVVLSAACFLTGGRLPVVWNIRRGLDDLAALKFSTRFFVRTSAQLSARPQRIIYCTDRSRTQHEAIGFRSANGLVLDNGFDITRFQARAEVRRDVRKAACLSDDDFVIGCVGRYNPAKGHANLIEAFKLVLNDIPSARLVLTGRGSDWHNDDLVAKLRSEGVVSRVILLGECPQIEQVYPMFDVLCSSSIAEGFPNVVAEAMLCELPCVVTDTGASRQIVEGIGVVVPPRSAEALADALRIVARLPVEERRQIGLLGRRRIVERYSLPAVIGRYRDLYRDLASQPGR
jgi:glycosyltransferase involved in cell wall biosynthesis